MARSRQVAAGGGGRRAARRLRRAGRRATRGAAGSRWSTWRCYRHRSFSFGIVADHALLRRVHPAVLRVHALPAGRGCTTPRCWPGAATVPFASARRSAPPSAGRIVRPVRPPARSWGWSRWPSGWPRRSWRCTRCPRHRTGWATALPLLVAGVGSGLVIAPNQALSLAEVPVARAARRAGCCRWGSGSGPASGSPPSGSVFFAGRGTGGDFAGAYERGILVIAVGFVRGARGGAGRARGRPAGSPDCRRGCGGGDSMLNITDRDGVRLVELPHGKVNALDLELLLALIEAFEAADPHQPIVLTGAGRAFSAGVDLRRIVEGDQDYTEVPRRAVGVVPGRLRPPRTGGRGGQRRRHRGRVRDRGGVRPAADLRWPDRARRTRRRRSVSHLGGRDHARRARPADGRPDAQRPGPRCRRRTRGRPGRRGRARGGARRTRGRVRVAVGSAPARRLRPHQAPAAAAWSATASPRGPRPTIRRCSSCGRPRGSGTPSADT